MKVFSPAKLNLFLHITGKRADGYHNLQTVFCRLDFGDFLDFEFGQSSDLLQLTGAEHLGNLQDNLITKAVHALAHHYPQHARPVAVHLDKKIPTGAGLGGGSSNAAATLLALNQLWNLHLPTHTLIDIAKSLGADVPFFVINVPYAIGEGIGEILTPITLPSAKFLLLFPNSHNSTQGFFQNPKLTKNSEILSHEFIMANKNNYLSKLSPPFFNAFEIIAKENPNILTAFDYLNALATNATPRLTGTGSTVFLPLDGVDSKTAELWQKNAPCPAVITETLL